MNSVANLVLRLLAAIAHLGSRAMHDATGQSQLEYELLIGFVVVVAFVTLTRFGAQVNALITTIIGAL